MSDHISKVSCSTTLRSNHTFQTIRTSVFVPLVAAYNETGSWWICEKMWGQVWDKIVFETRISAGINSCEFRARIKPLSSNRRIVHSDLESLIWLSFKKRSRKRRTSCEIDFVRERQVETHTFLYGIIAFIELLCFRYGSFTVLKKILLPLNDQAV